MTIGLAKNQTFRQRLTAISLLLLAAPLSADQVTYRVLVAGEDTGHLIVDRSERQFSIDFD